VIATGSLAPRLLLVLALLAPALPGAAAEQKAPAPQSAPAEAPPPVQAIPLAEIAARATEASAVLRGYEALEAQTGEIAAIRRQLPEASARLGQELEATLGLLREQPTLATLEAQQHVWSARQVQTTRWLDALTRRATELEGALTRLAELSRVWTETGAGARAAKAPEPILRQVAELLATVDSARMPLQARRAIALDLQSEAAQQVARCQTALAQIAAAQREAVGGLLARDGLPLWSPALWERARTEDPRRIGAFWAGRRAEILLYVHDPSSGLAYHLAILVALAGLLWAARHGVRRGVAAGEDASPATAVFDRPFSAALLLTVFVASTPLFAVPPMVRYLFQVLAVVPAIRLMRPVMGPDAAPGLYVVGALSAFSVVPQVLAGAPWLEPALLALEMLAGMAALGYALAAGHLRRLPALAQSDRLRALRVVANLLLLLLAATLAATALGYVRLARLLASGILGSAYLALGLAGVVRVTTGLVALLFRMWPVRRLQMVAHHRDLLERRARRVLIWLAVGTWLLRTLDHVGLLGPMLGTGQAVLSARLERGALKISVEDLLAFVLTLWLAHLLSAFLRFALEEEVYPRIGLARGLSYALSSLLNYGVLTLGVMAGLAVLGLDLTKLTVLAGAFGVGIGFGLQSMVNNFVSGLILLFERPIHVGDTIEAGDILGNVRRIGIRASTVRTWQGAEIVVPNAQLITERVTNWTLSDRQRRIDLPVGVNYAANPKTVMDMLEAVARAHPRVLRQPAPQAFFTGFGDSSINFELRAWTDQFEQWFQIRSELATAVYDAVTQAAGVSFPFPQREVRILNDPASGPADRE
jgi:small-conductance mechanosensitive channel